MASPIPTAIVDSVAPIDLSPRRIAAEFRALWRDGARIVVAGAAKDDPEELLRRGYGPKYRIDLFDTRFYLGEVRQNPDLRFFVAWVVQPGRGGRAVIHPRLFYKDVSLVWRAASHFVRPAHGGIWIGKGAVVIEPEGEHEHVWSNESTTDLPLEMQTAMERLSAGAKRVRTDHEAPELVLREGPAHRIEPYRDFTAPRERARSDARNLVNGGRRVARFTRKNDPTSLVFVRGYEPDFARGIVERSTSTSSLYGGRLRRFRILSANERIQYFFFAGPEHVWIVPPQATTTELSSFGLRTVDVAIDEEACVPGYEYHYMDDFFDPPQPFSQIPEGWAGDPAPGDDSRADASAWIERLPVVRRFRREVLARRKRAR